MSSKSKGTILSQKSYYEIALEKREKGLKDRGLPKDVIRKDAIIRHIKAKIRESNRRLLTRSDIDKKMEELAIQRAKKVEKESKKETALKKTKQKPSEKKKKKSEVSFSEQSDE